MRFLPAIPLGFVSIAILGVLGALASRLPWDDPGGVLTSDETLSALRLSFGSSLLSLGIALILALPSARFLVGRRFPGRRALETLLDLPMIMPPLVAGIGLLYLFGRKGLGGPLAAMGIDVLFSPAGVIVAQTFVATTVLIRACSAALEGVDRRLTEVAATLRARPRDVFWSVELPSAASGIAAGLIIAWSRALGEFGATLILAGATRMRTETLPIAVYLNITTGDTDTAVACAMILLATAFLLLLLLRSLGRSTPVA